MVSSTVLKTEPMSKIVVCKTDRNLLTVNVNMLAKENTFTNSLRIESMAMRLWTVCLTNKAV